MTHKTVRSAFLCVLASMVATGCITTPSEPSEPIVRTVTVKVATPVPCPALAELGEEPVYADNPAAIAGVPQGEIGQVAALRSIGRAQRNQRLMEYVAARLACMF